MQALEARDDLLIIHTMPIAKRIFFIITTILKNNLIHTTERAGFSTMRHHETQATTSRFPLFLFKICGMVPPALW